MKLLKQNKYAFLAIFIILTLLIYNYYVDYSNHKDKVNFQNNLTIHFIDVGQADSILVSTNNHNMLIDGGNNDDGKLLVKYFKNLGINSFDYIIATHPHEDHIGGLDNIIYNFKINKVYMPDTINNTKSYYDLIKAIDNNNLKITIPKIDETITLGDAIITFIYTGTDNEFLNNSCIVLKMKYGNTFYLFTADATKEIETKIINKDIKADVLKVAHHGEKNSTTMSFLKKVDPKYAIISVGKNDYGLPSEKVINRLNQIHTKIYKTNELGTIIINSDGNNIEITNKKTNTNK